MNRDYHAGRKGTFMDDFHHNRYFKDIGYNTDPDASWATGAVAAGGAAAGEAAAVLPVAFWASSAVYEARLESVLRSPRTLHVEELDQLVDAQGYDEVGAGLGRWGGRWWVVCGPL